MGGRGLPAGKMATLDPFDFDNYFLQRMAEFFGPDLGPFMRTSAPAQAIAPTPGISAVVPPQRAIEEWTEYPEERAGLGRRSQRTGPLLQPAIPIDIGEGQEGYWLEAALPGVPKDHIEVTVDHNNVLTIVAQPVGALAHACQATLKSTDSGHSSEPLRAQAPSTEHGKPESQPPTKSPPPTPQESPVKRDETNSSSSSTTTQSPRNILLSERPKGRLHRSVRLPKYANASDVKTCVENGVLCLFFGKLPSSQIQHKISI